VMPIRCSGGQTAFAPTDLLYSRWADRKGRESSPRFVRIRSVAAGLRAEIDQVKVRDADFASHQAVLHARMAAVISAQRAMAAGEVGAAYALRQGLLDLSAISELVAESLPAPSL
jgi:hypothetical protein